METMRAVKTADQCYMSSGTCAVRTGAIIGMEPMNLNQFTGRGPLLALNDDDDNDAEFNYATYLQNIMHNIIYTNYTGEHTAAAAAAAPVPVSNDSSVASSSSELYIVDAHRGSNSDDQWSSSWSCCARRG